jgi:hypothetical protein
MQQFHFDDLSATEKKKIRYVRVRNTGPLSRRIPDVSPWDFGIAMPWLRENQSLPENERLADWGSHGDPPGFNAKFIPPHRAAPPTQNSNEPAHAFETAGSLEEIVPLTGTMSLNFEPRVDPINTEGTM